MPSEGSEARRRVREHRAAKLLALREQAEKYLGYADDYMTKDAPGSVLRAQAYAAMASATADLAMLYKWAPTTTEEV